ncbi:MAG TPA: 5-formyltetrahydrofolate cyclo-ligase, partial [Burkholderiales bacterium]|nr:5-formyltetrahydrofolate cyclo-ligase [Burkholderiales bacterium]
MDIQELRAWRKNLRNELIEKRVALSPKTLVEYGRAIDAALLASFPKLHEGIVGLCWPHKHEYDARFIARTLRERGATTALPVVVAPKTPLIFREWHPGTKLVPGVYDIPYPVDSPECIPDTVLLPMNGFDAQGYRLGYGGGFFDRTLAGLPKKPLVIGVTYEFAKLPTIHPQSWDIPVDYVATERGIYKREE